MRSKEFNTSLVTLIFLVTSLVSGGAAAILVQGVAYEVLYAIHKITSVVMAICVIILIRVRGME